MEKRECNNNREPRTNGGRGRGNFIFPALSDMWHFHSLVNIKGSKLVKVKPNVYAIDSQSTWGGKNVLCDNDSS